ncbi:MAG TPA: SDR family oxidoreductase [Mycobacteriales bacterium]|jgi:uncharacterized protein YbjT (DUF2867 family)
MTQGPSIAVTGATGALGGRVAARLAAAGVEQRLVVRDAARAPSLPGADVAQASYEDTEAMRRAMAGVETVFLVPVGEMQGRVRVHTAAVDAIVAAGVRRIVYASFLRAAPDATFTFARDHYATEQHIRGTGAEFTFLRESLYLDLAPTWVGSDGVIRGPAHDGRVAWVSRDDIADVAAAVLTTSGHEGQTYDVTGPVSISMAELADELAKFSGRPVRFEDETLEQARASRASSGAPDWAIEGWVTSYAAVGTGELDVVSDTVATLAGHPPQTLAEFLHDHPPL